jgi:hypothetical protein
VVQCDVVQNSEMAVPFIGRRCEWRDRKAGGEVPTGGAPITHRLLEEEVTGQDPFKGEMKRRSRMEARGAVAHWRAAVVAGGAGGRRRPGRAGWPNCLDTWAGSGEKGHGPHEGMDQNQEWAAKTNFQILN